MRRSTFIAALLLTGSLCSHGASALAAGKKKTAEKPDAMAATVERVLRSEVAGPIDRRAQLAEPLKLQPDSAVARWQAGFVRDADTWRSFDGGPRGLDSAALLQEYRRRRED